MGIYRFYSNPNSKNRTAIVGEHSEGMLRIAVSRCSKKDHFIKKKGRAIAEGRLRKNKLYTTVNMDFCDVEAFVKVAKRVAEEVEKSKVVIKE